MVGRPTLRYERGQQAHPVVRDGSGCPPKGLERVGRPTRRSWFGRETHQEVQEG